MASFNSITIVGRLGRDPETKFTNSGKAVCNFVVAVDNGYGDNKTTDWFDVTCWDRKAEFVQQYIGKGREVLITGRMNSRKWEDKDGNKRINWGINAQDVVTLDKKPEGYEAPATQDYPSAAPVTDGAEEADPFADE